MQNKGFVHLILPLLIVVALAGGGYFYWQSYQDKKTEEAAQEQATQEASLGAEVYESGQNPVKDKLPSTNPFEEAKINPFEE